MKKFYYELDSMRRAASAIMGAMRNVIARYVEEFDGNLEVDRKEDAEAAIADLIMHKCIEDQPITWEERKQIREAYELILRLIGVDHYQALNVSHQIYSFTSAMEANLLIKKTMEKIRNYYGIEEEIKDE